MRTSALVLVLSLGGVAASVGAAELPQDGADQHRGVGACSGGPCHGAGAPGPGVVRQNEYVTWHRDDAHARAYTVLLDERSQRIAHNLALPAPAHETALCLDCHTDHVPANRRGAQFAIDDGIGCEACHGGSQRWLEPHAAAGASHARNRTLGLYPTDEPVARAELCLSCHFGTDRKFVTHRLMGAGHPRLSFELDTFTHLQPAHFTIDTDYRARGKMAAPAVNVWAVGQAVQARELLAALASPARSHRGVWPEFVLFDCHACHHPMSELRWVPRPSRGLAGSPGVARLNDSSLLMLRHLLRITDPDAARDLVRETRALHAALNGKAAGVATVVERTIRLVNGVLPRLAEHRLTAPQVRAIAASLLHDALAGEYSDYAAAEQAVMGVQVMAVTLDQLGELDAAKRDVINADIEALLEITHDDETFRPARLPPLLHRIEANLR